jgi:CRP-like cAMP-binding protein
MNHPNAFLASLSDGLFEIIRRRLRTIELVQGATLMHANAQLEMAYFPHSGVLTLVTELSTGQAIENGLVGRNSLLGAGLAIAAGNTALCTGIVQIAGIASAVPIEDLRALAKSDRGVHDTLVRHDQCLQLQAQQAAACNMVHNLDARLASWLLRCHDLVSEDKVSLTQELIGEMLGVRRTSVTLAAARLHDAALVDYRRGHIYIRNRDGLKAVACECYETLRLRTSQLLEPRAERTGQTRRP